MENSRQTVLSFSDTMKLNNEFHKKSYSMKMSDKEGDKVTDEIMAYHLSEHFIIRPSMTVDDYVFHNKPAQNWDNPHIMMNFP